MSPRGGVDLALAFLSEVQQFEPCPRQLWKKLFQEESLDSHTWDNACIIGAWHNSLDLSPPGYLVSPLLKVKARTCKELIVTFNPLSLGDRGAIAKFHGVQRKETSIIVAEDFVFDKYVILHEMGHVFGCAHEKDPDHDSPIEFNPGK